MLTIKATKVSRALDRMSKKHLRIHTNLVQKLRTANRRSGILARKYLTAKGQQVAGLRAADSKRRLLYDIRRGTPGKPFSLNSVSYSLRVRGQAHKIDAGRWVPRGANPGKLKRPPRPRSPTSATIRPQKGLFLIRRSGRKHHEPHFRVRYRTPGGQLAAAKINADFGSVLRRYNRGAWQIYQRSLTREIDLAGMVRRGR